MKWDVPTKAMMQMILRGLHFIRVSNIAEEEDSIKKRSNPPSVHKAQISATSVRLPTNRRRLRGFAFNAAAVQPFLLRYGMFALVNHLICSSTHWLLGVAQR